MQLTVLSMRMGGFEPDRAEATLVLAEPYTVADLPGVRFDILHLELIKDIWLNKLTVLPEPEDTKTPPTHYRVLVRVGYFSSVHSTESRGYTLYLESWASNYSIKTRGSNQRPSDLMACCTPILTCNLTKTMGYQNSIP